MENKQMKLSIISHTPNPEQTIAYAARLCYSPTDLDGLKESITLEKSCDFVKNLMTMGHFSPVEHVSFTFAVEGISRACSHQLVRHRIASYSQQSQRYVKLDQFEYIIPKEIENNPEAKHLFIKAMEQDQEIYDMLVSILFTKHFESLVAKGKDEKTARREAEKKAIEDSRYVFPNACETKLVFTMNVRTLLNFLSHRCCNRAQDEIRELAWLMLEELKKVSPTLFKSAGPKCINGECTEGKLKC